MNNIMDRFKNYFKSISKDSYKKLILFLIPLIGIVCKGIFLQGFIQNKDPYSLNLSAGFFSSIYFILFYFAFALIFLSFGLLFKGKGRVIYLFVIDILFTALTITDVMYFRGFLTVPSVMIVTQTANLDNLQGALYSMMSIADIVFFIDLIILGIYVYFTRNTYKKTGKRAIKSFVSLLIVSLLYIGYIPFNLYVLHNKDVHNGYIFDDYDPTNTAKYFSPIGYHIMDVYDVVKNSQPYTMTAEENAAVADYYNFKNEDLPDNQYAGISKGKNLLIIQVESLESFIIGHEYNGQKITPVMDNLIKHSLYFPNVYEQVNEGTSADCDLMVDTSMLPITRGCTFFRYPNATYNSLPKILTNNGYEAEAIHPDKGSFWNYANALRGGIGFKNFKDYSNFNDTESFNMGLSDNCYFSQVPAMLNELKRPFYARTVTLSNHGPFTMPDELKEIKMDDKELAATEMGGYIQTVKYTDTQIGKFLDELDKEGILDNTVVAITGDHTGVHKYYNSSIEKLSNKEDWYEFNGEPTVPLIIYDKSANVSKTFDTTIAGQIDIMPTLLYMLGIDKSEYENTALGRNLLNTTRNYAVLTDGTIKETGLSDDDKKYIENIRDLSDKMIRSDYFKDK